MPSPFPGMDPYLESHWGDVHTSLVTYARNLLQPQLPQGLRARVEEHVTVQSDDNEEHHGFYPDVRVIERNPPPRDDGGSIAVLTLDEPLLVPMTIEPATERELRIVDTRSGDRIITTIEFLSPANKEREDGRRAYCRKRDDLIDAGVNLVEIDLLRGGEYVLAVHKAVLPEAYREPYRISVWRAYRPGHAEVYRTSLREKLPTIRIPLRKGDADVGLDLQKLIAQSYVDGGYEELNYRREADPPLRGEDADWADALLRETKLR